MVEDADADDRADEDLWDPDDDELAQTLLQREMARSEKLARDAAKEDPEEAIIGDRLRGEDLGDDASGALTEDLQRQARQGASAPTKKKPVAAEL